VRTYAELLNDVHRYANVFHAWGVRRTDGAALLAPNCDELVTATLSAQLAGIAAPINSGLSPERNAELLRKSAPGRHEPVLEDGRRPVRRPSRVDAGHL